MSFEKYDLIGNDSIDKSIIKRSFLKVCHQQGATLDDADQKIGFIYRENNICHQSGITYVQYDITIRKDDITSFNEEAIKMKNNAFAYTSEEARLVSTGVSDLEYYKFVGKVSTIMSFITSKNEEFICCFDKIDENNMDNTSLKQILLNNHDLDVNKGKLRGQLPLEHIFGFCTSIRGLQKNYGFT